MGRKDGRWQVVQMREYLDFNKEFDPSVFQPVTPKGFVTVDRIKNRVGLEKGNLTDDEIATKVAKEFVEAMIAGDYQKASPLYGGIPPEQLSGVRRRKTVLRPVCDRIRAVPSTLYNRTGWMTSPQPRPKDGSKKGKGGHGGMDVTETG